MPTLLAASDSVLTDVDAKSFLTIVIVAAVAALTVAIVDRRFALPVVVVELILGIVIGPQVLSWAQPDSFIQFFADLGLGMLFFFAGYEIDFQRIKGPSLRLAVWGWVISLSLAYGIGGVLVFALVTLATNLGLDLLLGGFAAGIIVRMALRDREVAVFESKLTAIGYGFLIPFFFIVSGMEFNLDALTASASGMLKLPLFLALFLVVRGPPALLLYRGILDGRDRLGLAFFSSTELPLVVAITTVAVDAGKMRTSTSAALVGAAILSTLIYPLVGLKLRAGRAVNDIDQDVEAGRVAEGLEPAPAPA